MTLMPNPPDRIGELIRTDLRNIMSAQEAYRLDHDGYAADFSLLQGATGCRLHPGNVAELIGEESGYKATVGNDGLVAEAARYTVYVGRTAIVSGKAPHTIYKES